MPVTPNKDYTELIEIDPDTGVPTGNTKPNVPGYSDYIPPFYDAACLPSTTTTSTTTISPDILLVEVINNSLQILEFSNLKVSFQIYPTNLYNGYYTILPGTILNDTAPQLDDYLQINYIPLAFSSATSVFATVFYKVGTGIEVVVRAFVVNPFSSGSQTYIPTPRSFSGSLNRVRIVFSNIPYSITTTSTSTTTTTTTHRITTTSSSTTSTTTATPTTTTTTTLVPTTTSTTTIPTTTTTTTLASTTTTTTVAPTTTTSSSTSSTTTTTTTLAPTTTTTTLQGG